MKLDTRLGIPTGTGHRTGHYPWPEKESRDDIIRKQMDTISQLVNSNLKNLADELWPYNTKTSQDTNKDDNVIPFPGKWHSD